MICWLTLIILVAAALMVCIVVMGRMNGED